MNKSQFKDEAIGIEELHYPLAETLSVKCLNDVIRHAKNVLSLIDFNKFKDYLNRRLQKYAVEVSKVIEKAMTKGCGNISRADIKKVLNKNWSGKLYSERVWRNTAKLKAKVEREIMNVLLEVYDMETAIKNIEHRFEVSYNEARRLIRTEVNYTMNQSIMYKAIAEGYEYYKYVAIVDDRTSDPCLAQNGKVYRWEQAQVGVNYPPLLPNCRSTVKPIKKIGGKQY